MQTFRVSKIVILLQFLLLVALIILSVQPENRHSTLRVPILMIMDFIFLFIFISSLIRKVTVDKIAKIITVKTAFRSSSVNVENLEFAQIVNALGRCVLILNDGKRTVTISSLLNGMGEILEFIKLHAPSEFQGKFDEITKSSLRTLKLKEMAIYIILIGLVIAALFIKHF